MTFYYSISRYEGGFATKDSKYGRVPSDFIMDNVACTGSEETLFECDYSPTDDCSASEGAGVACGAVTLEGGSSSNEGNLFINGQPVCDDSWDNNDASVACRMLGYFYIDTYPGQILILLDILLVWPLASLPLDQYLLISSWMNWIVMEMSLICSNVTI